ncbi:MAG TPA: hypothetical protein VGM37_21065 [Armatimonadota bacterium]|jgi:hypothetical protein
MNDQLPTGLPKEDDPLDPSPNVDVLDPNILNDPNDDDNEAQRILAPGFGASELDPSF